MKKIWTLLFWLVLVGLNPEFCLAQLLPIKTFNVQDGLPQSQVTVILQDTLGYLWVGTADGLARFDGIHFENFTSHNGLSGNAVTCAYDDGDSLLWFGLNRSGISIYNLKTNVFTKFPLNNKVNMHRITTIFRDQIGAVWIGTDQDGLFRYYGDSLQHLNFDKTFLNRHISSIVLSPDSNLWVATGKGILIFNPHQFSDRESFHFLNVNKKLAGSKIENILFFKNKTVWIGTKYKGLIRAKWDQEHPYSLSDIRVYDKTNHLQDNWIRALTHDHYGNIWAGTAKGAVQIINPVSRHPRFFTITTDNGLGHNTIDEIFEDREGIIWIGTWGGGLNRYIGKYFETYTKKQGLPDNSVWGIYEDSLHTFWIATEKGLVGFRKDAKLNKLTPRYFFSTKNGLPFDFILSIEGDGHNGLWLGGWGNGLAYIQPYKKEFKYYSVKDGLTSNFIVSLKRDKKGNLWIATLDHGVFYFNPRTRQFKNYDKEHGFPSNKLNYIYKDRKGNFWFLTKDAGAIRFDGKNFHQFSGPKNKLVCGVTCMFDDDKGNFWFGTPSDGILVIKPGKGVIKHLTQADGLGGDNIFILAQDPEGYVWIGNKRGLDRFNPKDSTLKHYGFADGFLCLEPDQNVYLNDSEGHNWFGGIGGVTRYLPEYEDCVVIPPRIVLNKVNLYFGEKNIPQDHKLKYYNNHLTFYFTGLALREPQNVRYSFILKGFDKKWSPPTRNNSVTYSNLPPGHYTFLVRAQNAKGVWSEKPAAYSFEITPPFWMHWYFVFGVILFLIIIIYLIFRWRTRRIQKQNLLLEKKVRERTNELEKITENLKKAYSSLKESENKFRSLTETMSSAVFIYRGEKFVYVNHAFTVMAGYSTEELLNMKFWDLVHPDFKEMVRQRGLARQRGEQVPNRYEFKLVRKDGEERWVDFTAGRIEYDGFPAAIGTAFDITDRKMAEQAVKESELHLRTLINAMPDIVCFKDGQGRWIEANNFDLQLFEIENVPYKGKKDSELAQYSDFYRESFLACEASDEKAWQKGTISRGEEVIPRPDGTVKIFDVIKVPIFNDDGSRKGLVVIGRDITEKKKAEEALRTEKERLNAILSSIHEGVIATDEQYRILFMNDYARKITSNSETEVLNKNIRDMSFIQKSGCKEIDLNKIKNVIESGQPFHPDTYIPYTTADGRQLLIDAACSPILNPNGEKKISGVVITFRDVSEQKKLEEELFKARKLESLAILAGGLAHDFNNILTAIIGNLSLIKLRMAKTECPAKLFELVKKAEAASLRAQGLTQQLLTFSKGGAPIKKASTIQELILSTVEFTLRGSKVRYEVDLPDDLWPVEIDEGQISQVVNNLAINALQAMPDGGKLFVRAENITLDENAAPLAPGNYVRIFFQDTGSGIPADALSRIFDPYFTTKKKGSGLGLASSYSIIKKHGGNITVDSEVGKGTTFVFYLPASDKKLKKAEQEERQINQTIEFARILVMDDEDDILDLVKDILENIGFEVLEAHDGQEAINLYKQELNAGRNVDLVILDLTVRGGMGGKKTIKELRKINPEIPAIVSSGYSNAPIMANYREYGFNGVVAKPYKANELILAVQQLLGK